MVLFKTINPYSQQVLAQYEADSPEEVMAKLDRAHLDQVAWSATGFAERGTAFRRLAAYLRAQKEPLARLITDEMGKILSESRGEIEKCAGQCAYYAEQAESLLQADNVPTEAQRSLITYEPVGVVLAIMPWNFPFWQVFRYAVPALMAGNTTLLKPAPNTFGCGVAIEAAFRAAGFPDGIFQTLITDVDAVETLLADDRVGMVTLTGSERAGTTVAALAGKHVKKSVLELGGSDPLIVLADADLDKAAQAAVQSRMNNAGQVCIAAKRFLVESSVKEAFAQKIAALISNLRQGDPTDADTQVGPIARLDLAEQLDRQLQTAIAQGATLVVGGLRDGCNFQPALLDNVTPGSIVFQEETFGPLATITEVADAEQAVRLANQTRYGLSAAIWTRDLGKAEQMARQLAAGSVFINAVVRSDSRLPIGGVKKSGYGRELAESGIKEFCYPKVIYVA